MVVDQFQSNADYHGEKYHISSTYVKDWGDPTELHAITSGQDHQRLTELEEAFEQALKKLPENHRTAILLLKQQELSYQEIANIMEASESAVKTWIFRARQFLKQELKDLV